MVSLLIAERTLKSPAAISRLLEGETTRSRLSEVRCHQRTIETHNSLVD